MFYTYLWLREDGSPYYVGKGRGDRAFTSNYHNVHRPPQDERIIVQDHPSEEEAFEAERLMISLFGRLDLGTGCLRNLTEGGDGPSGAVRSPETRLRMRGPKSLEHREHIRLALLRRPKANDATIQKMSLAKLGKPRDPKAVAKLRATMADPVWRAAHKEVLQGPHVGVKRGPYKPRVRIHA